MLWHIAVYSKSYLDARERLYGVHIFSKKKLSIDDALHFADVFLSLTFPEWKEYRIENYGKLSYILYEQLPINVSIDAPYFVVSKFVFGGYSYDEIFKYFLFDENTSEHYSSVPQSLAEAIENYRRTQITLEYECEDSEAEARSKLLINDLLDKYHNIEFYKTINPRSYELYESIRYIFEPTYYIRIMSDKLLQWNEIWKIRDVSEYGDVSRRKVLDYLYLKHGLGFLANFLPDEICYLDELNNLYCYVKEKIESRKQHVEYKVKMKADLSPMKIETSKGEIVIEKDERDDEYSYLIFRGYFGWQDVKKLVETVEETYREYRDQKYDVKFKVLEAYKKILNKRPWFFPFCDVYVEDDTIVIFVPKDLSSYINELVGENERIIRAVEKELGMRIKILSGSSPNDIVLKEQLKERSELRKKLREKVRI